MKNGRKTGLGGEEKREKSLPTFTEENRAAPTFILKISEKRQKIGLGGEEKPTFWPEKVGTRPLLGVKSGQKNGQSSSPSGVLFGLFLAENGLFWPKNGVFAKKWPWW